MIIGRVIKNLIEDGMRVIQGIFMSDKDVREAEQIAPFGIDSAPIKDMVAIYSETSVNGEPIIVGYINPIAVAKEGEIRLFSVDSNGSEKNYIYIKNNGDIEVGGSGNNLVRYNQLSTELSNYNTKIIAELVKIQTAIVGLGGAYPLVNPSINISEAKTPNIQTK